MCYYSSSRSHTHPTSFQVDSLFWLGKSCDACIRILNDLINVQHKWNASEHCRRVSRVCASCVCCVMCCVLCCVDGFVLFCSFCGCTRAISNCEQLQYAAVAAAAASAREVDQRAYYKMVLQIITAEKLGDSNIYFHSSAVRIVSFRFVQKTFQIILFCMRIIHKRTINK